jgi:PAS domain S-box-containing protein
MPFENTGALLLHLDGRIAFASTYFCDLVGVQHDKVAGMSFFDFVFPEDRDAARNLFETTTLPHADPIGFRLRRRDGTEVWTSIQAAPLKEPKGLIATIIAASGSFSD